jgi:hypothetical protein
MSGSRFRKPVGYATSSVTMMTRCIKDSASEEAPKHGHSTAVRGSVRLSQDARQTSAELLLDDSYCRWLSVEQKSPNESQKSSDPLKLVIDRWKMTLVNT